MLFKIFLSILFLVFVFRPSMNYISDTFYGTNYNDTKKRVRFADDEIIHYHLSEQERNMKRKAYKKIRKQSKHYRQMDHLSYLMNKLKI